MMNPDRTKNRSTPANPNQRNPPTTGVFAPNLSSHPHKWKPTTIRQAIPRRAWTF